jgi:PAS domain S-box-containing protein
MSDLIVNKLSSILPKLEAFFWEINLSQNIITFNSDKVFKNNEFLNPQKISDFLFKLTEESRVNFENKIKQIKNNQITILQIHLSLKNENNRDTILLNGTINEENRNIIEGIGMPIVNKTKVAGNKLFKEASILEKAPVMICLTDIEGNIFYCNPEFSRITGYSTSEVLNKNSKVLKSGIHKKEFYKNLWNTILKGKTWEGKIYNRRKNGELYWEKAVIAPYYDKESDFKGFIKASEDITQQEKVKKQLKAERNLFLSGPVIVLKWDSAINGGITYTSPNIKSVLGYEPDEFVDQINYIEIIHPDDRERVVKETNEYIDQNTSLSFIQKYRIKTKSGDYKHFIDHTSVERDENNQIINFSGYLIDNTQYIEAQAELIKSESKYKDVFNTAGVGIVYTNKEGIIVDANRKFEELVFVEPGDLIGKSAMELINNRLPGKSARELLPVLFHILKGNRIDPKEIHIEDRYYEIQSDYNPHLQTNIGILRDITEQKIATQKVQESEQKYKYLVDHMNDGLVITNKNEELSFMNPAAIRIFEGDIDSFKNKSIIDVATPTSVDIIKQQEGLRQNGNSTTYYIEIITKNNTKKNLEVSASPVYKNNEYNGSFGILRDITEKIRSEMEIKSAYSQMKLINRKLQEHAKELEIAKEKAEESDRLKTAFLANISHEIRTPMNGIVGFAQLSMNPGLTEEKRSTYLQIITDSTMQLESVVMDIIDLSKIEGGEARFNKKDTYPEEIINEAFENNRKAAEEKQLNYVINLEKNLPLIQTDKTRFKQVINILLGNAIKFTYDGRITLDCKVTNTMLEIKITDTGIGIDEEHHEIIFEPFRQVEIAMKRKFGGTGLGLTIARKIAETFGGNIYLDSELNKGSTFTFTHPL